MCLMISREISFADSVTFLNQSLTEKVRFSCFLLLQYYFPKSKGSVEFVLGLQAFRPNSFRE